MLNLRFYFILFRHFELGVSFTSLFKESSRAERNIKTKQTVDLKAVFLHTLLYQIAIKLMQL